MGVSAGQPLLFPAYEGLVDIHPAVQLMEHGPCGLSGVDRERPLPARRRGPVFAGGKVPAAGEPPSMASRSFEDRAGGRRRLTSVPDAHDIDHRPGPSRHRGRRPDSQSPQATGAISGRLDGPHRFRNTPETCLPSEDNGCPHGGYSPPQFTSAKWRAQTWEAGLSVRRQRGQLG